LESENKKAVIAGVIFFLLILVAFKLISILNFNSILTFSVNQNFIKDYYFYILLVHSVLILVFLVWNLKSIIKLFSKINKKTWLLVLAILILGLLIRGFNQPFYDPSTGETLAAAKNFAVYQRYAECNIGSFDNCLEERVPNHPGGVRFIFATLFMVFGASFSNAWIMNVILGAMTSILVFFIFYLLFKDEIGALASALVFTLLKVHLAFSTTGGDVVINLFFITITFLFMLLAFKTKSLKSYTLLFLVMFYCVHNKFDNLVLLPIFALSFLIFQKKELFSKKSKHFRVNHKNWPIILFFSVVVLFSVASTLVFLQYQVQNPYFKLTSGSPFKLNNLENNMPLFLEEFLELTMPFILLFLSGFIFMSLKKHLNQILFLLIWLWGFVLLYGTYYSNSIDRFVLAIYPVFALLIGLGFLNLWVLLKKKGHWQKIYLIIMLLMLIGYSIFIKLPEPGMLSEVHLALDIIPANSPIVIGNYNDKQVVLFETASYVMALDRFLRLDSSDFKRLYSESTTPYFVETYFSCTQIEKKNPFSCVDMKEDLILEKMSGIKPDGKPFRTLTIYKILDKK